MLIFVSHDYLKSNIKSSKLFSDLIVEHNYFHKFEDSLSWPMWLHLNYSYHKIIFIVKNPFQTAVPYLLGASLTSVISQPLSPHQSMYLNLYQTKISASYVH